MRVNYDFHWDDERKFEDPVIEDADCQVCDLCYRSLKGPGVRYLVVELRAVCVQCLERFRGEPVQVNRTIGLLPRGCYARGKAAPPPSNGLGRGDT